ncbi:MAG: serine/threonine protein kinase [Xanthomonadales bacterium]|nr:serine/threonine protein kinase [Xanthomonadales bacterium]
MTGRHDLAALDAQLEQLLELPLPERQARLSELDRTEPDLAEVLRKLLRITAEVETRELRRAGEQLALVAEAAAIPRIPGYVVDGEIGRGGMATVYAGHREVAGVQQAVAIKVLRAGLQTPIDRARFVNEQRILARLRHPHIATLLDIGVVDEQPYMVLERIDGAPIDTRLHATLADLPKVLDALEAIIDAIDAAHAHLIVHRDIKPGNVLIDADGTVKLIDFGIAKNLDEAAGLHAERTATGHAPLTLRYASPEQLCAQPVGIASDLYQFGLLAYRLLSGGWPWPDTEQAWPIARLDAAIEPQPPSRHIANPAHRRRVAGDLDAIVLKCLRRAPGERYRHAAELREDLQRHRTHRPVLARQQTWRYRSLRYVHRHRLGVVVGAAAGLLLLAGVMATASLAARNAEHAARIDRVLDSFTELLTQADPYQGAPGSVTVGQVVDVAGERLLAAPTADPAFDLALLERFAAVQGDLQNADQQLALLARARELAERLLQDPDAAARIAAAEIAARVQASRYAEAESALAAFRQRWPGPLPLRLALNEARLSSDRGDLAAADLLIDALLARVPAEDRLLRYDVLVERGYLLSRRARYVDALQVFEEAGRLLDLGDLRQRRLALRHRANLANALGHAGRPGEAAPQFAALHAEYAERLGHQHPRVLQLAINQAQMQTLSAQPHAALATLLALEPAAIATLDARTRSMAQVQIGRAALFAGDAARVMPAYVDALESAASVIGVDSPGLAPYVEPLAWALFEFGEDELAVEVAQRARTLDPAVTIASDIVLELLASRVSVSGRPDPEFPGRLESACDRVEYAVLAARLNARPVALPESVPADCGAPSAQRLEALGLHWDAPPTMAVDRRMDSPLIARLRGAGLPADARLAPAERARIQAWIEAMDTARAAAD